MKLGIIGLPHSGKKTIFEALTQNYSLIKEGKHRGCIGVTKVLDNRVDILKERFSPKKTVYAQVKFFLPKINRKNKSINDNSYNQVRDCNALIIIIKNFNILKKDSSSTLKDFLSINQELIFSDYVVIENRLKALLLDKKRGKSLNLKEFSLLERCLEIVDKGDAIRNHPEISTSRELKGYSFLSAKPILILINNDDEDKEIPVEISSNNNLCMVIRGKLEKEISQLSQKETKFFLKEFEIDSLAAKKVIEFSYELLGLISFFTVGKDEVKAWSIKLGTNALDAADVIHSDIKKGFIRAEVLSYDDLILADNFKNAKIKKLVRLENKGYVVSNGDIINFRFNV